MFPSEMAILMAVAANNGSGKNLINRPMDITGEYIGYLYDSLVSRGYLKGNGAKGYQLTSTGGMTLLEFLQENEARVKDTIRRLKKLGIEYSQEMDKLRKERLGSSVGAKHSLSAVFTK